MIPKGSRKAFPATFYGDENGKIEIENKEQADQILAELEGAEYKISKLKRARAAIPCAAVYHLHPAAGGLAPPGVPGAPDDEAAQELYEGVEIEGMARSGLITYMRTDSLRLSEDALKDAADYILERWGKKYLPDTPATLRQRKTPRTGTRPSGRRCPAFRPIR